jgi:hypothetical protein
MTAGGEALVSGTADTESAQRDRSRPMKRDRRGLKIDE